MTSPEEKRLLDVMTAFNVMSSVIRIEGPGSSSGQSMYGTLPFQPQQQRGPPNGQHMYGTLPFQQQQQQQSQQYQHGFQRHQQPQQNHSMQFYSTLPPKPERRVQFADGSKPGPPTYESAYSMRSAPTNLSRPLPSQNQPQTIPIQLGQAVPMSSRPAVTVVLPNCVKRPGAV
ncbi:hypothetical protein CAPTEDRAFT_215919 [Capitella teleta]|uniref:Uncharacterized protein n=1 Tax=Capitella teleta TaxID=283909 RepID=R7VF51_CAPTE|nr:hypothetical protein CAPTEDRAFT_215919 [Capitella teleta]|eukprot:ELU14300.1 hypothetical protein CAPTEDRAFT_215919 [Capitella teleta]